MLAILAVLPYLLTAQNVTDQRQHCNGIPVWSASQVYSAAGNVVTYQGKKYRNKWWTKNESPTKSMNANPWQYLGDCAAGALAIVEPTANTLVATGSTVGIKALVSGASVNVARVEFYVGNQKLGQDLSAPYTFVWQNASQGTHNLVVKAYGSDNTELGRDQISIKVADNTQGDCWGIPAWSATQVYAKPGNVVAYQGKKYRNKWWTRNERPAGTDGNPWELLGDCGGGSGNVPPTVGFTQPANNSQFRDGQSIDLRATAQDSDGQVTSVKFYANNTLLGEATSAPYAFAWNGALAGQYQLTAIAQDNDGATTTSAAITVSVVSGQPPAVSITSPNSGSQFAQNTAITIKANASDADGTVTKVAFYANGQKLGEATNAPYQFTWNNAPAGQHQLTAIATDNEGKTTTSATVWIQVGNSTPNPALPKHLVVGYWHNWNLWSAPYMPLQEVPVGYNVICVAFAIPVSHTDMTMTFAPAQVSKAAFIADIKATQQRGTKVLISIGGATAPIELKTEADRQKFITSMRTIITEYGFDGMDIDVEGSSVILDPGDTDFTQPTTPKVKNLISATRTLCNEFGDDFILSAAPEVQYLQGGFANYGGAFGGYLPVIHGLRDKLTYVHPQLYNTGTQFGPDNQIYAQSTADFAVAMSEMLLRGFPVGRNTNAMFPPLRQDQVAIGLPAKPEAAPAGGYLAPAKVHQALDYLMKGTSFGGRYTLQNASGYPDFRGVMTWSVNWDKTNAYEFVNNHAPYFNSKTKGGKKSTMLQLKSYPNPMKSATTLSVNTHYTSNTTILVFNRQGNVVKQLCQNKQLAKGQHSFYINLEGLPDGVYYCTAIQEGKTVQSVKIIKK
ncbi:chitinase [Microscilla marina ATCC 23134]|uniref:chitinase n=2 Tax=Microscilla marina TaxID=1027 RepID=A1ZFU5_MICM2|nr:chitinase [Microscilla marina ATCC 23134]